MSRRCDYLVEGIEIADQVVGRQDQQSFPRLLPRPVDILHRTGDCRRGIAANRFKQDGIVLTQLEFVYLALGDEAVILADHDDRRQAARNSAEPEYSILQQRGLIGEAQQLLGIDFAGQRPEPGSCSSSQNHGLNCSHWYLLSS